MNQERDFWASLTALCVFGEFDVRSFRDMGQTDVKGELFMDGWMFFLVPSRQKSDEMLKQRGRVPKVVVEGFTLHWVKPPNGYGGWHQKS